MCCSEIIYGNALGANARQQRFMEEKSWETRAIRAKTRYDDLHKKVVAMCDLGINDGPEISDLIDDRQLWGEEIKRLDNEGTSKGFGRVKDVKGFGSATEAAKGDRVILRTEYGDLVETE